MRIEFPKISIGHYSKLSAPCLPSIIGGEKGEGGHCWKNQIKPKLKDKSFEQNLIDVLGL